MMSMKNQENKISVCVIGGGAAGMMAAITAADNGANVTLFEKNKSQKIMESERLLRARADVMSHTTAVLMSF